MIQSDLKHFLAQRLKSLASITVLTDMLVLPHKSRGGRIIVVAEAHFEECIAEKGFGAIVVLSASLFTTRRVASVLLCV